MYFSQHRPLGVALLALAAAGLSCSNAHENSSPLAAEQKVGARPTTAAAQAPPHKRVLRICADPNNLPFSNQKLEGFENKIADLLARDMGMTVQYVWRAQRRGFFRHAFKEDGCDVVMGVPAGFERAAPTAPYYRSAFAFVYRKDSGLDIRTFDAPALRTLKVGVQIVGEDGNNPPPAYALARRGIVDNVAGYTVYGDYTQDNPPARIVEAVAKGEVGVAVVWGPLAGYFATRQSVPLEVVPVSPQVDESGMPFAFDICVGVRKGDKELKEKLDAALVRRRREIEKVLDDYGMPRVPPAPASAHAPARASNSSP
jgi:quinoprotein dehydrogenase-associated probable ABC transporter substrate-binding protein